MTTPDPSGTLAGHTHVNSAAMAKIISEVERSWRTEDYEFFCGMLQENVRRAERIATLEAERDAALERRAEAESRAAELDTALRRLLLAIPASVHQAYDGVHLAREAAYALLSRPASPSAPTTVIDCEICGPVGWPHECAPDDDHNPDTCDFCGPDGCICGGIPEHGGHGHDFSDSCTCCRDTCDGSGVVGGKRRVAAPTTEGDAE